MLGGGAAAAGLLLAAPPAGSTVGSLAYGRLLAPAARARLMFPLAVCASAVLMPIALRPPLPVVLAILAVSGACAAFQVAANASFVLAAPQEQRSQAFGVAQAGMSLGQGAALLLAGAAAEHWSSAVVAGGAGVVGAVAAVILAVQAARTRRRVGAQAGDEPRGPGAASPA